MISWLYQAVERIRAFFRSSQLDRELEEELATHVEMLTQENVRQGMDAASARHAAILRVGSRAAAADLHRETRGLPALETLVRDVRYGCRQLRRNPGFTFVAVLTLALGIGANTAIFSLANSLLWRALPVEDPERLMLVEGGDISGYPLWEQLSRRPHLFESALTYAPDRFDITAAGARQTVDGIWASGSFFDTLGVRAHAGRTFSAADDRPGGGTGGPVAVISYRFWQRRFNGAAGAIGQTLVFNKTVLTIVGVTPPSFLGLEVGRTFDVIVPAGLLTVVRPDALEDGSRGTFVNIVRLKPAQTVDAATAALSVLPAQTIEVTEGPDGTPQPRPRPPFVVRAAGTGLSYLRGQIERPLFTMMSVVGLVLLLACANLANLMLARATGRRQEMSVRRALGASSTHLFRQLWTESVLLASAGAAGGLLIASWGSRFLMNQLSSAEEPVFFARFNLGSARLILDLSLDWHVLAFTAGVTVATAVLFGIAPALKAAGGAPMDALKEQRSSTRGGAPNGRGGFAGALIVAQVGLSLVLVIEAALFVRTFTALSNVDPGFDAEQVLMVDVGASPASLEAPRAIALLDRMRDAFRSIPGVTDVAMSLATPPWEVGWIASFEVPGRERPMRADGSRGLEFATANRVSPRWFRALGIRLIAGRDFADTDRKGTSPVVIVNEEFVRKFLPGRKPIGQTVHVLTFQEEELAAVMVKDDSRSTKAGAFAVTITPRSPALKGLTAMTVVGVVSDTIAGGSFRDSDLNATMYQALAQFDYPLLGVAGPQQKAQTPRFVIRTTNDAPMQLSTTLSRAVSTASPGLSLTVRSLADQVDALLAQERVIAGLSGFFGLLALLLAAVGLYGVTAYAITSRRREIAIRLALGARPAGVVWHELERVAVLVAIGMIIGLVFSAWTSTFVAALLYGLEPHDPATLSAAVAVLTVVAVLAAWIPARRATRIHPVEILRAE